MNGKSSVQKINIALPFKIWTQADCLQNAGDRCIFCSFCGIIGIFGLIYTFQSVVMSLASIIIVQILKLFFILYLVVFKKWTFFGLKKCPVRGGISLNLFIVFKNDYFEARRMCWIAHKNHLFECSFFAIESLCIFS